MLVGLGVVLLSLKSLVHRYVFSSTTAFMRRAFLKRRIVMAHSYSA